MLVDNVRLVCQFKNLTRIVNFYIYRVGALNSVPKLKTAYFGYYKPQHLLIRMHFLYI